MKKFFFYVFLMVAIAGLILTNVDYPHEYQNNNAAAKHVSLNHGNNASPVTQQSSVSPEPSGLGGTIDTMLMEIRQFKQTLNHMRCGAKFAYQKLTLYHRLSGLSDDDYLGVYYATGLMLAEDDRRKQLSEQFTDEQLARMRLNFIKNEFHDDPSDLNNRKLYQFCHSHPGVCDNQTESDINSRMTDDTQNWLLKLSYSGNISTDDKLLLLKKAAYAGTNNNYLGAKLKYHYETVNNLIDSTSDAFISAHGAVHAELSPKYDDVVKLCSDGSTNPDCEALGKRLIRDNNTYLESMYGYSILKSYYSAQDNEQMLSEAEDLFHTSRENSVKVRNLPHMSPEFHSYIMSNIASVNEQDMSKIMLNERDRLLDENPSLCLM